MRSLKLVLLMLAVSLSCQAQFGGNQTGGDLSGYTSKKDIDYVGDGHIGHKLDIYYPNDGKATHNVIIHIYGSAWGSNNSKGSADLGTVGKAALEAGYIFVTPNHRTYNDALYPAQINDIKAVVRYLRGNAATLKIDASFIAISGFSSGGHLASLMGVTRNVKSTYTVGSATMDIEGTLGAYTSYSSWVDAVCDWSGPVDCRYKTCGNPINMSPENDMVGGCSKDQCPDKHALLGANTFIDASDAPVMVVHGSSDNIVPQCEGEMFYNNLKKAGVDCEYFPTTGGHGVDAAHTGDMITFFNRIRKSVESDTTHSADTTHTTPTPVPATPQTPYNGKAQKLPGKVEMENYDLGGEGVGYHDTDSQNQGGKYREDGVDVVTAGNGYAIGYTAKGEWLEYTLDADSAGIYEWAASVSSGVASSGFKLYIDSVAITNDVAIPQTGNNSWDTYQTVTGKTPALTAGAHVLRVEITGDNGNMDYISFSLVPSHSTGVASVAAITGKASTGEYELYTPAGIKIGQVTTVAGENPITKLRGWSGRTGIYVLRGPNGYSRLVILKGKN